MYVVNTYSIFNRRILGLDTRVWRVMFILVIISIVLLAYRIIDKDECIPFKIEVRRNSFTDTFYYTGESVRFVASVPLEKSTSAEKMTWDFNDNSVSNSKGPFVAHIFTKEAKYYVTASINPSCEEHVWITVKNKPPEVNDSIVQIAKEIIGATSTLVGKTEEFMAPAQADSFYEWVILYHPEIRSQYSERAKFQFASGGNYTIQLTLDHDRIKSYTKRLYVEPPKSKPLPKEIDRLIPEKLEEYERKKDSIAILPPPKDTVANTAPKIKSFTFIPEPLFLDYLKKVAKKEMTMQEFEKYGIFGNTPVIANGEKGIKSFTWLCSEIIKRKARVAGLFRRDVKIESAKLQRYNGVVQKIEVKFDW